MSNLALVKSESFGSVQCDFYKNGNEFWMTRRQIGDALEYSDPQKSIKDIHSRHKDRLDMFSRGAQIALPSGGRQTVTLYSAKGIYEICRWSQQPKADSFYDWVYEMLEGLRTGKLTLSKFKTPEQRQFELQIKFKNASVRQSNALIKVADKYGNFLSPQSLQTIISEATSFITGRRIIPLPEVKKTWSATEIGEELNMSANMVGRIANKLNLKTDDYGITVLGTAKNGKQIPTFQYFAAGRKAIIDHVTKHLAVV